MNNGKLKFYYYMFAVSCNTLFSSIFPLVYQMLMKNVNSSTYMFSIWAALVAGLFINWFLTSKKFRDYLLHNLIEFIILLDVFIYALLVVFSINIHDYSIRMLFTSIINGTTSLLWREITLIPTKKLFIREELIDFERKESFYSNIGCVVGGLIGIGLSTIFLSYELLSYFQVVFLVLMGMFDIFILRESKKFLNLQKE